MEDSTVEVLILDSIAAPELSVLVPDFAEVALDSMLDSGIVKDVPVFGVIMKTWNIAGSVRDRLFAKKLLRFLAGLSDVPLEQRREQLSKLTVDVNERQKVGENLLLLLDRMNDMAKPRMMASAFKAYLEERIGFEEFRALSFVIDAINMSSIGILREAYSRKYNSEILEPDPHVQHLAMCGLFSFKFRKIDTTARFGNGGSGNNEQPAGALTPNSLGRLFCEIVLTPNLK